MVEEQAQAGDEAADVVDISERGLANLLSVFYGNLREARERIDHMEVMLCSQLFPTVRSELAKSRRMLKRIQNERHGAATAWEAERQDLLQELALLRSEGEEIKANAAAPQPSFGKFDDSKGQVLGTLADHKMSDERRPVLAVMDPQVPRAAFSLPKKVEVVPAQWQIRLPNSSTQEKENVGVVNMSKEDTDTQRLRKENEHLREQLRKTVMKYRGSKNQYKGLQAYLSGKSYDSHGLLNASILNSLEKPVRIGKRKFNVENVKEEDVDAPDEVYEIGNAFALKDSNNTVMDSHLSSCQDMVEHNDAPSALVDDFQENKPEASISQQNLEASTASHHSLSIKEKRSKGFLLTPQQPLNQATVETSVEPECERDSVSALRGCARPLESSGKQRKQLPAKTPGYKYVEPIRKKAEREALQGTECKQCKKFYDAVLVGDATGLVESRCKHQEISRHRFTMPGPPSNRIGIFANTSVSCSYRAMALEELPVQMMNSNEEIIRYLPLLWNSQTKCCISLLQIELLKLVMAGNPVTDSLRPEEMIDKLRWWCKGRRNLLTYV